MWQLSTEQAAALTALQRRRDLLRLGDALGQAFPAVRDRVGARFPELIALGAERGLAHGLDHLLALARYLACWFMLGAEFETREANAWALAVLADDKRDQGAKVYQLTRRCREELARLAAASAATGGTTSPAAFDESIALLDGALAQGGAFGSLLPRQRLKLGTACDLDAVDLRAHDANAPIQFYRFDNGQVLREAVPSSAAPVTRVGGTDEAPPALPTVLHLLAPTSSARPNRLRLRTRCAQVCDPGLHALVVHSGQQGQTHWRGEHAADLMVEVLPQEPAPPEGASQLPVIAQQGAPGQELLELATCGLRDGGASMGESGRLATQLQLWPDTQHVMVWQRPPLPVLNWPELGVGGTPPTLPTARVRIERNGQTLDAARWQAGLEELDRQLVKGLARLATAWERESGVTNGRLQAEPRLLCGTAALTWGWAESAKGMLSPPMHRTAGWFDLIACQLSLRLSGTLSLQGSLSQLHLHCPAAETMQLNWETRPTDADPAAALAGSQASFSQAFVLGVESMAHADLAMLDVAGPVHGAIVGACGLRPRADGIGLQWFFTLGVEAASVLVHVHDPVLGQQLHVRPLLPAMSLVDWSLG